MCQRRAALILRHTVTGRHLDGDLPQPAGVRVVGRRRPPAAQAPHRLRVKPGAGALNAPVLQALQLLQHERAL
jgi:hypothetical protein